MAHFIAANCAHLRRPGNVCRCPALQRSPWSPLRWLGVPVACVFSYGLDCGEIITCAHQVPIPRPAPPKAFSSVAPSGRFITIPGRLSREDNAKLREEWARISDPRENAARLIETISRDEFAKIPGRLELARYVREMPL
jgi:hypothetical protein